LSACANPNPALGLEDIPLFQFQSTVFFRFLPKNIPTLTLQFIGLSRRAPANTPKSLLVKALVGVEIVPGSRHGSWFGLSAQKSESNCPDSYREPKCDETVGQGDQQGCCHIDA
jgi:hypothetical protein